MEATLHKSQSDLLEESEAGAKSVMAQFRDLRVVLRETREQVARIEAAQVQLLSSDALHRHRNL